MTDASTTTRAQGRPGPTANVVRTWVRDIPDYPQAGVMFRDITPLLADAAQFASVIDGLVSRFDGEPIDHVAGVESRGFMLAAPIAYRLGAGLIPARKAGKLPWSVVREEYQLEYGTETLEMHRDAVQPGERVLIIDDVLATGGTAAATSQLIEALQGEIVGLGFLIELGELEGRRRLAGRRIESLAVY